MDPYIYTWLAKMPLDDKSGGQDEDLTEAMRRQIAALLSHNAAEQGASEAPITLAPAEAEEDTATKGELQ